MYIYIYVYIYVYQKCNKVFTYMKYKLKRIVRDSCCLIFSLHIMFRSMYNIVLFDILKYCVDTGENSPGVDMCCLERFIFFLASVPAQPGVHLVLFIIFLKGRNYQ